MFIENKSDTTMQNLEYIYKHYIEINLRMLKAKIMQQSV